MKFVFPVPGGRITGRFDDPSVASPTRIHGAIDIAPLHDNTIIAPEGGFLHAWVSVRQVEGDTWPRTPTIHGKPYDFSNYFYDMYGGCLILVVEDPSTGAVSRTHILTHSYGNQIFNRFPFSDVKKHWVEQHADDRFPIFAVYTDRVLVREGDMIGHVGNAGFSTGAHVHWEIHHGYQWNTHRLRMDPQEGL